MRDDTWNLAAGTILLPVGAGLLKVPHYLLQAYHLKLHLWIERVPSDENISDLPSRCHYQLMRELGAVHRKPKMAHVVLS